jgi:hypothetical protein
MTRTLRVMFPALLFAACNGGLSTDAAREILAKSDAVQQAAPTVYVPEGKVIKEIVGFPDTQRVVERGWVRCVPTDNLFVRCKLTPAGREASRDWRFDGSPHDYPGWWIRAGRMEIDRVKVRKVSDTVADVTFFARAVNNETGEEFGRDPSGEGQPYSAVLQKVEEEWRVVELQQLIRSGG